MFSQPPLVAHFLFDQLALGSIEAAAPISGTELNPVQSALTKKLTMRQAAQLAAIVALEPLGYESRAFCRS
jgi:hypothetical protein